MRRTQKPADAPKTQMGSGGYAPTLWDDQAGTGGPARPIGVETGGGIGKNVRFWHGRARLRPKGHNVTLVFLE